MVDYRVSIFVVTLKNFRKGTFRVYLRSSRAHSEKCKSRETKNWIKVLTYTKEGNKSYPFLIPPIEHNK